MGELPPTNLDNLIIAARPIEYTDAKRFILEYEWLGNMGTSKYCYGLFLNEQLSAVECFGPLVAPTGYKRLFAHLTSPNLLQLCRGASTHWAPTWAGSKLISESHRMLRRDYGTEAVVAYADPRAGEVGTVYQASNAIYLGMTEAGGGMRYTILGKSYDPRKVHKKYGSRARNHLLAIDPGYSFEPIPPKHRYIFVLAKGKRKKLIMDCLASTTGPYPKRNHTPMCLTANIVV